MLRGRPLLFIVGPTAVGKSALALYLASRFNGEIVNADSRQVYRGMDIGTAKSSPEERGGVPHHLVDILAADQDFNLALFLELARTTIQEVHFRERLPIVVGGTGQYVWALYEGWQVPAVPPNVPLRRELEEAARRDGPQRLHDRLAELDPPAAARIDPSSTRRVIRALEIYHTTGATPTAAKRKIEPAHHSMVLGLTMERKALYERIDRRVDEMLQRGLKDEVQGLQDRGYSPELPAMSSMGYKEMSLHLRGELDEAEAVRRTKYATHRFVRRQNAWFRLTDPRIRWLEVADGPEAQATAFVEEFLASDYGCDRIASEGQGQEQ